MNVLTFTCDYYLRYKVVKLYYFRSVLRLSSLTLLFVSAWEYSSSRMEKRSPLSSPMTVAWTSLRRTMKCWLQDSVERVTPSVIFPESGKRAKRMCQIVFTNNKRHFTDLTILAFGYRTCRAAYIGYVTRKIAGVFKEFSADRQITSNHFSLQAPFFAFSKWNTLFRWRS